jgi:ribosome-associated translation inhibitor RaiA
MEITFLHKNLSKVEEGQFVDYVNQKTDAIRNLLKKFADDASILRVSIEKFTKHDAYEVEFYLSLPSKSLVATEASHQITKAVDLSKDRLITQIKKHMAHLRKDRSHESIRTDMPVGAEVKVF